MMNSDARPSYGIWALTLAAIAGLGIAIYADVDTDNGIHGTYGLWLVIASSALMVLAALALTIWPRMTRGLRGLLIVLILLDIAGTGFAAYMLEASWLVGAMAAALLFWIVHMVADPTPGPRHVAEPVRA
ncbi:MAG TPA: hypothetical protein VIV09_09035 [Pseudolabrys sp.]|jgi:hypothetical protein